MREQEIKELNRALKGEHMAIETFDHFIKDTNDEKVKNRFQEMQKVHKYQAIELAEHIQNIGGNPVNTAGISGMITEAQYRLRNKKYIDGDIVKTIVEGEEMGIDSLKDIKAKLTKFDNISLIDNIIKENIKITNELKQL